jgi:transcription elongation factor GreB
MSKAFVKDDVAPEEITAETTADLDDEDESPFIGAGGKNYITTLGLERLKAELHDLLHVERPKVVEVVAWAASNGDRSENADYQYGKRRLREIDRRIRFLTKRIDAAEVVEPTLQQGTKILFGATVTVTDQEGLERTYKIVGSDEADAKEGKVSWASPVGQALLQASEGDAVTLKTPRGDEELDILKVRYVAIG